MKPQDKKATVFESFSRVEWVLAWYVSFTTICSHPSPKDSEIELNRLLTGHELPS